MDGVAPLDQWADGEAYEAFMGRWSRSVARELLGWLALPPGLHWLDVGCGTGALSQVVLEAAAPAGVVGVDRSEGYVAHARRQVTDPRARFETADAQRLPFESGSFDVAVSGLVLNFLPEPERTLREMARVVRAGGVVAAYVWDYAAGMEFLRRFWDAAVALDPAATQLDEGRRFPICDPERLSAAFQRAGLAPVEVRPLEVPTRFQSFEEYWAPFLGGQGPAPGYVRSLEEDRRARLRERLRHALPPSPDGAVELRARAWAARAQLAEPS